MSRRGGKHLEPSAAPLAPPGRRSRADLRWVAAVAVALAAATALAFGLSRAIPHAGVVAWLYVPVVLVVALRWGLLPAMAAALLADLLILTFTVNPLLSMAATDKRDYVELAIATLSMLLLAALVSSLNTRLLRIERGQAAAAGRQQERARLEALIEHSSDGIALVTDDRARMYVSPSFASMLGFSVEELATFTFTSHAHPDDRAESLRAWEQARAQPGVPVETRVRVQHKDGSWRWLESTVIDLRHEPDVGGLVVNSRDVTAAQKVSEQVRTSRDQLATILANVSDGVMVQSQDGRVLYVNDAGAQLCGFATARELLARPVSEVLTSFELMDEEGEPLPFAELPAQRVLSGEQRVQSLLRVKRSQDETEQWARVTAAGIDDWRTGLRLALSVFRDVTREEQLRTAQQQAIQVRDRFLSTASHELRTPLTTLRGQLQLSLRRLRRGAPLESVIDGMEMALAAVDRLNYLTGDLLDLSRLTSGRLTINAEPVRLDELLGRLVAAERNAEPVRTVEYDCESETPAVYADPVRLEQVFVNLLSNARKYSPEGSPIGVRLACSDGSACIEVRDHGIGIPPEEQAQIFTPFHRAANIDRGTQGLGLGLAIAHDIVVAHGGTLTVASTPGDGSTFRIVLPLIQAAEA